MSFKLLCSFKTKFTVEKLNRLALGIYICIWNVKWFARHCKNVNFFALITLNKIPAFRSDCCCYYLCYFCGHWMIFCNQLDIFIQIFYVSYLKSVICATCMFELTRNRQLDAFRRFASQKKETCTDSFTFYGKFLMSYRIFIRTTLKRFPSLVRCSFCQRMNKTNWDECNDKNFAWHNIQQD